MENKMVAEKMRKQIKLTPCGITRCVDELGRISIPRELIKAYGWELKKKGIKGTCISVEVQDGFIVLKRYTPKESCGILRGIDSVGRLCIPKNILSNLEISEAIYLEVFTTSTGIYLRPYNTQCYCCGEVSNLTEVLGRKICPKCLEELKKSLNIIKRE